MKCFYLNSTHRQIHPLLFLMFSCIVVFTSCSTLEKASVHGLTNGFYELDATGKQVKVYAEVTEDRIDLFEVKGENTCNKAATSTPSKIPDSLLIYPLKLKKQSLDIDITTILLKYRPSVLGLPQQLTTDLNMALYAGWRHDHFRIRNDSDPLGKPYRKITNLGYDFGIFAGPGTTPVNPFSTNGRSGNEYSGMVLQTGIAAFLESNIASFGVAIGADHLMNRDRKIWIYNRKPWFGFVVGIALN